MVSLPAPGGARVGRVVGYGTGSDAERSRKRVTVMRLLELGSEIVEKAGCWSTGLDSRRRRAASTCLLVLTARGCWFWIAAKADGCDGNARYPEQREARAAVASAFGRLGLGGVSRIGGLILRLIARATSSRKGSPPFAHFGLEGTHALFDGPVVVLDAATTPLARHITDELQLCSHVRLRNPEQFGPISWRRPRAGSEKSALHPLPPFHAVAGVKGNPGVCGGLRRPEAYAPIDESSRNQMAFVRPVVEPSVGGQTYFGSPAIGMLAAPVLHRVEWRERRHLTPANGASSVGHAPTARQTLTDTRSVARYIF